MATVVDSQEDIRNAGFVNGKPAVIRRSYTASRRRTSSTSWTAFEPLMPVLQASVPPSMHLDVTEDRTTMIRASVQDVEVTLVISVLLVILVVFCFLRSAWATAIPSVAVPLSLVGTFGVMYLLQLLDRQPLADGADDLDRLRRGRRHRGHRKHLPLSGAGTLPEGSRACAARARLDSRFFP